MWGTISKLWIQTHITITFWCNIFCVLTLITWKLQFVYRRSTYRMTALLLAMSTFCVELDVRYKWWVMSRNIHHSLSSVSHLYVYILQCITWNLQVKCGRSAYQTTAMSSETLFVWLRVAWEIRLESYSRRHASVVLWYNIACILSIKNFL